MLFNSWQYAVFLPIAFLAYYAVPRRYRPYILLTAGFVYYAFAGVRFTLLLACSAMVSWYAALQIERKNRPRFWLYAALLINFGILFIFKYFNFFISAFAAFFRAEASTLRLILPAGISFYTFSSVSYTIDVYREKIPAERSLLYYTLYATYFPKLLAGPIERAGNLLKQFHEEQEFDYDRAMYGMRLIVWGLFKKMVIADTLAKYVSQVYGSLSRCSGGTLLAAAVFYSIQIYCDFSGYSDTAIGTSELFGIRLSENFRRPYLASSLQGFWRRWHISLSTWFRDYVYIPLGGSRCAAWKRDLNLIITFLCSGLWHGASWTFVLWGLIHGAGQVIENHLFPRERKSIFAKLLGMIAVFAFTTIAWIFFRADTIADAGYIITHLFQGIAHPASYIRTAYNELGIDGFTILCVFAGVLVLIIVDFISEKYDILSRMKNWHPAVRWTVSVLFVLLMILIMPVRSSNEFLYFRF
ncbi:MAG: MBOAT family protein [Solobacterium sp.]|nr:MBOAT family protein [Solobacterium sp.]